MSGNMPPPILALVNENVENANAILAANRTNNRNMREIVHNLGAQVAEYKDRWMVSESKIDSMKTVVAKQWHEINLLHRRLDEVSKRMHLAESMALINEKKYKRMYNKMKAILLDSARDVDDDNNNKHNNDADGEGAA